MTTAVTIRAGQMLSHRRDRWARPARLSRRRGRLRRAGRPRLARHLRAWPVRRPRHRHAEGRRCAASRPAGRRPNRQTANEPADSTREWEVGVLYGPHGAPDFFQHGRHRDAVFDALTRCISTAPAPASASSARRRNGRAATAARRGFTPPTSTTMPMPSARSISPATCRSSSAPTARASAASSARR